MAQDEGLRLGLSTAAPADDPWQYVKLPNATYMRLPADLDAEQVQQQVHLALARNIELNVTPAERKGTAQTPEGSAFGRFIGGAWQNLDPIAATRGIVDALKPQALGGTGPIATGKAIWAAMRAEQDKAVDLAKQGRYTEAVGHGAAGILPLVGPAAAHAGERIAEGDVAGGLGEGTGLLAPVVVPAGRAAVRGSAAAAARVAPELAERAANKADLAANQRVTKVIAPRVGANKGRFTNMASDVAPTIARETTAVSRGGVYEQVASKLQEIEGALDDANDARMSSSAVDPTNQGIAMSRKVNPPSLIDALVAKRDRLTMKAMDAEKIPPERTNLTPGGEETINTERVGKAYGKDVVPNAYRQRVAKIQEAITAIKKLGPTTTYDNLKLLRQAYDQEAKPIYSPSMTADYMRKLGEAQGAADITGSIRDFLGKLDPGTAKINARYSLLRTAHDVLRAAEETELTRPTIGRTMLARGLGASVGGSTGGAGGAFIGAVTGPLVERIANGAAPGLQLVAARHLAQLADALRAGQVTRAGNALVALKNLAASVKLTTAVAGAAVDRTQRPEPVPATEEAP